MDIKNIKGKIKIQQTKQTASLTCIDHLKTITKQNIMNKKESIRIPSSWHIPGEDSTRARGTRKQRVVRHEIGARVRVRDTQLGDGPIRLGLHFQVTAVALRGNHLVQTHLPCGTRCDKRRHSSTERSRCRKPDHLRDITGIARCVCACVCVCGVCSRDGRDVCETTSSAQIPQLDCVVRAGGEHPRRGDLRRDGTQSRRGGEGLAET